MPINRVYLENFRLFKTKDLIFSKDKNFIQGLNGSGKTSILESIEILVNSKSFRTTKSKDCINHKADSFQISLKGSYMNQETFMGCSNKLNGRLSFSRKLNNKSAKSNSILFLQTILAKNLRMIEGEPDLRRDHLNNLMFHVKPSSYKKYSAYSKALKQRNRCLKQKLDKSEILVWTEQLATIGVSLSKEQYEFFNRYREILIKSLKASSVDQKYNFIEETEVKFIKGWERSKSLLSAMEETIDKDLAIGYTSQGPHRMDCEYYVKGKKASSVLSRGQLKILILLIFLINHELVNSFVESDTVLLIDDLGSELDLENLKFALSEIAKVPNQVILTGIQGENLEKLVSNFSNFKRINL
jgi:DNA replication and repair protein RecF